MAANSQLDPASARQIDLTGAPGSDLSFDDLFSTPGETSNQQTPQASATEQTPPATPQAPEPPKVDEPFLRVSTGTVYKSREDAERGIAQKDESIDRLRQYAIEKTGFDPLTGKQHQQPQAATAQPQPQVSESYLQNPKKYWDELLDAAQKNDPVRYANAQARYVQEIQEQTLGPFVPMIQELARQRAVSTVSQSNHEIQSWIGSDDYKSFLDDAKTLRDAIDTAEHTPQMFGQLSELYRLAYLANQGRKLPEIVKAQAAQAAALPTPQTQAPPVRTTTPSATMVPPQPVFNGSPSDLLRSSDGRKSIIDQFERRGSADTPLERFR